VINFGILNFMKKSFNLREVTSNDWKFLLEWRNEKTTRLNSLTPDWVTVSEHKGYIKDAINSPNRRIFILEYNKIPVGTIREDRLKKDQFELSYTVSPEYRGQRFCQIMVSLYLIENKGSFLCRVNISNIASNIAIEKLGFKIFNSENYVNFYNLDQS